MQETQFNFWVRKICWRRDRLPTPVFLAFPCGSARKVLACNVGDLGSIPGSGRSPGEGKGYPFQYSGLENSMESMGSQRVRHYWVTFTSLTDIRILEAEPNFMPMLYRPRETWLVNLSYLNSIFWYTRDWNSYVAEMFTNQNPAGIGSTKDRIWHCTCPLG